MSGDKKIPASVFTNADMVSLGPTPPTKENVWVGAGSEVGSGGIPSQAGNMLTPPQGGCPAALPTLWLPAKWDRPSSLCATG